MSRFRIPLAASTAAPHLTSLAARWQLACLLSVCLPACAGPPAEDREAVTPAAGEAVHGAAGEHDDDDHTAGVVALSPEAAARAGIRTAPIAERRLSAELATTGQVDYDQDRLAHVSPRLSGRVHRVDAALGDAVDAGQTLAEIDSIELGRAKAELLAERARQELAESSYRRARGLHEERIVSEQEMLEAEARLRQASAALGTAEETLYLYGLSRSRIDALSHAGSRRGRASLYPLTAPIAGRLVERHATLGELVDPERNLFTVADLSRVWIWIDVSQRDLGRVHVGDGARARVDAYPGEVFAGEVSYLGASVDADTRTARARIDVPNREGKLRPGMFVTVELSDPHSAPGEPMRVVPETAVVRAGDERFVFVAAGAGRFERRRVRLGRSAAGAIELLEGPEPGTEIVVEGAFLLKSAAAEESMGGGHAH